MRSWMCLCTRSAANCCAWAARRSFMTLSSSAFLAAESSLESPLEADSLVDAESLASSASSDPFSSVVGTMCCRFRAFPVGFRMLFRRMPGGCSSGATFSVVFFLKSDSFSSSNCASRSPWFGLVLCTTSACASPLGCRIFRFPVRGLLAAVGGDDRLGTGRLSTGGGDFLSGSASVGCSLCSVGFRALSARRATAFRVLASFGGPPISPR
mmetsp:Transcript_818/g.3376  ORF Transcript_818/g.3376 Transcript_818/m.3376 type:complete len:211 (+) Transcript_818:2550-3182(+)